MGSGVRFRYRVSAPDVCLLRVSMSKKFRGRAHEETRYIEVDIESMREETINIMRALEKQGQHNIEMDVLCLLITECYVALDYQRRHSIRYQTLLICARRK